MAGLVPLAHRLLCEHDQYRTCDELHQREPRADHMKRLWSHVVSLFAALGGLAVLLAATALGLWRAARNKKTASDEEKLGKADIEAVRKAAETGDDDGVLQAWRKHRK